MSARRTITLTDDEALFVDDLIASGRYRSDHEVIAAGLKVLRRSDLDVETWLRDEVVPVAAKMRRHPDRAISADDVFEDIRERHRARLAGSK
ncbi:MAG: type toxin-antitoxin system ParD family antitoxin [Enterovirga sp.]|jgi:antitoxin ParD1/3/4|nr:type toxin-antitoxin system ParD family antitoxin [Enterovirga sp.]